MAWRQGRVAHGQGNARGLILTQRLWPRARFALWQSAHSLVRHGLISDKAQARENEAWAWLEEGTANKLNIKKIPCRKTDSFPHVEKLQRGFVTTKTIESCRYRRDASKPGSMFYQELFNEQHANKNCRPVTNHPGQDQLTSLLTAGRSTVLIVPRHDLAQPRHNTRLFIIACQTVKEHEGVGGSWIRQQSISRSRAGDSTPSALFTPLVAWLVLRLDFGKLLQYCFMDAKPRLHPATFTERSVI